MDISLLEVKNVFQDLINQRITREDADKWATDRMNMFDDNELRFVPETDEENIWSAITYLCGVDLKISMNEYMHSIEDIQKTFIEKWS